MADAYSPRGILLNAGLTSNELIDLRTSALNRLANGDLTQMSGGGKSSSTQFTLSASEMLIEIAFAMNGGAGRVNRVVYDVNR